MLEILTLAFCNENQFSEENGQVMGKATLVNKPKYVHSCPSDSIAQ